mgnify:CR=1 FL=1
MFYGGGNDGATVFRKKVFAAEFSRTENLIFRAKRRRTVPAMLSQNVIYALNEQFGKEMYSANLYLAMSAFLQNAGLPGLRHTWPVCRGNLHPPRRRILVTLFCRLPLSVVNIVHAARVSVLLAFFLLRNLPFPPFSLLSP